MFARFEIRRLDLVTARKTLGGAIGVCPKEALFKGYIQLELEVGRSITTPFQMMFMMAQQLREFDRVRTLYEKYLEVSPDIYGLFSSS
jgi:crooked neck